MSRRNTDAITIHSILDWIEDNLESPLSLEKVSERSGYSKWHLQRMFKKETGHSLGQYIRSRKMTEIAQKLKESNEPILYLAERYGFESQQTLTRTFKNYFDVPPHKYRMTNMQGESRFLHPLNHYNNNCAYSLFCAGRCGTNHAAGCYFLWQCRGCSPIAGTTTV